MNGFVDHSLLDADIAALRVPPHSIEAESSVLGGLLMDNRAWDRVGDLLVENDFYRHEHKLTFVAVSSLINACKPADVVTVYAELQKAGTSEQVGGLAYLNALAQFVPSAGNVRRYAEIVRERAILRQLIAATDEIASSAFNVQGKAVDSLLDDAMAKVMAINPEASGDEWESMERMVVSELDMISARADGDDPDRPNDFIATGLTRLDDILDGGLRAGQLVIIGARPGMGKTAIADTIGVNVALHQGLPVGKFSMEMQNHEGGQRALSNVGRIPLHALRRPERMGDESWSRLTRAVETLRGIPFFSNDKGGLNINQLRAKARALKRRHGLKLLIVDYLQLMSGTDPRAPRTYQLEEASRGLKALAKELSVPVIALVQVNRGVEKEQDPMPRMSDIKDCGAIEQDADIIVFLHRPIVVSPDLSPEWKHYAKASVAKQRGGRTGLLDLLYVGENTRFADWPTSEPVPTNQARIARNSRSEL
ncbi:replicative DNA helicase [Variovorax boronicumulans]|uniref:replicative DNA helicase n=1 Tax=Variovorax boronicumulans TaxID=436515 RepID=UPI002785F2DB|nr:replicative DNA helicase [Variovorax boronicumulans]MDQ0068296.1 replicative DNA helicase [Variovorax boronicumulans]